jgi:YVTN family beta-propeller protein
MKRLGYLLTLLLLDVAAALAAATPSPALLVLNKADNALAIVDPASGKVVGLVPVGESPHEVSVSADGKLAFVSNYGSRNPGNTISVIDLAAQKEIRRLDLGPLGRPHGLDVAAGKVYFTSEASKLIASYDVAENRIDWMMGTGQDRTHMVILTKDHRRIFTSNGGSNTITAMEHLEGPAGWTNTQIPVGKAPEAIDISPDGKEVWTAHRLDGGFSIIDVAAKKVVQTVDVHTKGSNRLKFTPDGKLVLISDDAGGELVIVDAATRKEVKRIKIGQGPEGIQMVPDGSRAYIACSRDNKVAILDLRTLEVTGSLSTGKNPDGMAWAERK